MRTISELAFDHILEKLRAQEISLANLRNQAAISGAVTGLIGTVMVNVLFSIVDVGQRSVFFGENWLCATFVFFLFGGSILFSGLVLTSFQEFHFSFDAKKMLEGRDRTNEDFLSNYVKDGEWYFSDNEGLISGIQTYLWFSVVCGWMQIIPWAELISKGIQ